MGARVAWHRMARHDCQPHRSKHGCALCVTRCDGQGHAGASARQQLRTEADVVEAKDDAEPAEVLVEHKPLLALLRVLFWVWAVVRNHGLQRTDQRDEVPDELAMRRTRSLSCARSMRQCVTAGTTHHPPRTPARASQGTHAGARGHSMRAAACTPRTPKAPGTPGTPGTPSTPPAA